MKQKILYCIIFSAMFLFCANVQATPITNLYQASVSYNQSQSQDREQAIQNALANVFVKVTGNPRVLNINAIHSALDNAENYLEQYGYQNINDQNYLVASFYPQLIDKLLQQNNIAIWGNNRPQILVWLITDQNKIEAATDTDAVKTNFEMLAKNRGLPLVFPIMDMTDLQISDSKQFCQFNQQMIQKASKRYHPDVILVGCLNQDNANWNGHFNLITAAQTYSWNGQNQNSNDLLQQAIDKTTSDLAQDYAVNTDQDNVATVKIIVSNVKDYRVFNQVKKYLLQLTPVRRVAVDSIAPNIASFDVEVIGGANGLQQALSLDHALLPQTQNNTNQENDDNGLYYKWLS